MPFIPSKIYNEINRFAKKIDKAVGFEITSPLRGAINPGRVLSQKIQDEINRIPGNLQEFLNPSLPVSLPPPPLPPLPPLSTQAAVTPPPSSKAVVKPGAQQERTRQRLARSRSRTLFSTGLLVPAELQRQTLGGF